VIAVDDGTRDGDSGSTASTSKCILARCRSYLERKRRSSDQRLRKPASGGTQDGGMGWGGEGGEILGEITRAGVTELRITRDDRTRGGRYKGAVGWEGAKNEIQRGLNPIIK